MAAERYSFQQFSADLARFGFASADDLTSRGLASRHRNRLTKAAGDAGETIELGAARDRLSGWDKQGRPPFNDRYREEQAEAEAQERLTQAELDAARRSLEWVFFWRRWRRRAMLPLRGAWWAFAHLPIERLPWVAGGIAFVLLWPFVQDSRVGAYVPHVPSVYAWLNNTDAVRYLRGDRRKGW